MVIFLISGLWHGAAITFVIWGMLHGVYRIVEETYAHYCGKNKQGCVFTWIRTLTTFIVVMFTWNLFRADDIHSALEIYVKCFRNISIYKLYQDFASLVYGTVYMEMYGLLIIGSVIILFIMDYFQKYRNTSNEELLGSLPVAARWLVYYTAIILIMFCFIMTTNEYGQAGAFLYFQF